MSGWDDLEEWFDEIVDDELKAAKTEAGEVFLKNVTSPTSQHSGMKHSGSSGLTPVFSGNLMANTEVGVNSAPDGTNSVEDEDGEDTYRKGLSKVKSAEAWDTIYIVNATEYNIEAEFTGWEFEGKPTTKPYRYWQLSYNNTLEAIK